MSGPQKDLFDIDPEPWELDDAADQLVATVVFAEGAEGEFDYLVPDALRAQVTVGQRLRVPLGRGNRPVIGYCVRLGPKATPRRLKSIAGILDPQALISPRMLRLTRWMVEQYLCTWGKALETVVPAAVRGQAGTHHVAFLSVPTDVATQAGQLELPSKQSAILQYLVGADEPVEQQRVLAAVDCTRAPLKALLRKGLVQIQRRRVSRELLDEPAPAAPPKLALNLDQQRAVDLTLEALRASRHETFLLFGVTGSGKTEVYMRAIEEIIGYGRQAIVLVPEISLTPQTVQRFRARFSHVAVLHSHLTGPERNAYWQKIARAEVRVVVGARSAVFAPTPNLGLIVLDEEHDASFKQDLTPRYHARDVARYRAETESIPLILGSATPSLESWHGAHHGTARLLEMPRRVLDRPLPQVAVVDLRSEFQSRYTRGAISRPLHQAMTEALRNAGQVILLLNRRGFSTHIQCPACGHVVRCRDCDIALTHHRMENTVICHYCDFQTDAPPRCPQCGFEGIRYSGLGTQKLEAEVRARFPDARSLRMDSDTMKKPGSHQEALARFRQGDVQVLLGTQMIAKGLDFPNVTLVGVINADTGLHLPDFRAAERTFQLVTQVAGRTGRGSRGGRVMVQTFSPDHYAIEMASRHDYRAFASMELGGRQALNYPPYGSMLRVIFRGSAQVATRTFAQEVARAMEHYAGERQADLRLLGPVPAPIAKLRGRFRFHLLLMSTDRSLLQEAARHAQDTQRSPDEIQWLVDVDPLEMM